MKAVYTKTRTRQSKIKKKRRKKNSGNRMNDNSIIQTVSSISVSLFFCYITKLLSLKGNHFESFQNRQKLLPQRKDQGKKITFKSWNSTFPYFLFIAFFCLVLKFFIQVSFVHSFIAACVYHSLL